jgi:hypothetical protein
MPHTIVTVVLNFESLEFIVVSTEQTLPPARVRISIRVKQTGAGSVPGSALPPVDGLAISTADTDATMTRYALKK